MTIDRPQYCFPRAPIGSLLKRVDVQPRLRVKQGADRDEAHLKLIRCCPCLSCGMEPSEAAHVRMASAAHGKASGLGKKPEDRWALPLCAQCHRLARTAQHNRSEQAFWAELDINPFVAAERLYAKTGDLVAMRAVAYCVIAARRPAGASAR
ncbi:hypothetical protein IC762_17490 [Bradyrhizobium genosp. L]|uniref:hypothetical protein n=1 Tax=Bradyrhizobium genosp. L TaxID=83637 RepID=UPI0018A31CAD|nr:hypothetical protein [Bradyrhizobium genosp. L]QPF81621.1 hypothetical protein IC762_17490 [Bradyrhizobium genosp. L]